MTTKARVLRASDAPEGGLGGLGVRFLIWPEESGDGFALVEHPLKPRAPGAALHRHTQEDEYSVVIRGRVGAQLGDEVVYAEAGDVSSTIVLIHGAWMCPTCWDKFKERCEQKGYTCIAPPWPYEDRPIEMLRWNPTPAGRQQLNPVGER